MPDRADDQARTVLLNRSTADEAGRPKRPIGRPEVSMEKDDNKLAVIMANFSATECAAMVHSLSTALWKSGLDIANPDLAARAHNAWRALRDLTKENSK